MTNIMILLTTIPQSSSTLLYSYMVPSFYVCSVSLYYIIYFFGLLLNIFMKLLILFLAILNKLNVDLAGPIAIRFSLLSNMILLFSRTGIPIMSCPFIADQTFIFNMQVIAVLVLDYFFGLFSLFLNSVSSLLYYFCRSLIEDVPLVYAKFLFVIS